MRLQPEETSLVITGAWNPSILNPQWVVAHGFARDPGQEQFQVAMPMGPSAVFQDLRFTLAECHYIARPDALIFQPKDSEAVTFNGIEDAAARILSELQHTPITGVGHNFSFIDEQPQVHWLSVFSSAQQDLVDASPDGWGAGQQTLSSSFLVGRTIVNVQRYFNGAAYGVKFNFHHTVSTAAEAVEVLIGHDYQRQSVNLETAKNILRNLYGELE